MPHPFQIEEWRLLEDLKSQIVHRAPPQQLARHDSFPGASHNGDLLEPDLRQVFSLMGSGISWNMGESDLDDCEEHLARLCASLERILPPVRNGHHTTQYPRLEGLTQFLKGKPDDFYVYLACGRSLHHLFDPPVDVSHLNDCLKHVGDVLKLLMRLQESSKPQERDIEPPRAPPKRYAWKKSRVRNRANLVLDCIFDHIRCDTQHDIMLKLLQDPDESAQLPDLQLLLSPCKGADLWHDLLCDSAESYTYVHTHMYPTRCT